MTLPNLNYGALSAPNGDDVGIDNGIEDSINKILNAIVAEPEITQKRLSIATGLSVRTVAREIKNLRVGGVIRRVGSGRSGYWEIIK
ncbi:hypothetical protein FACS1894187_21890 [Synergistales bacterium]|nr:hypothetical protein FACS1894187_21890 [Synergistales bacterium]